MPIIFATIQIMYWCYIGVFSISANTHHTMSPYPPQYLISLESFDSVVPLKTERGYNLLGLSQNVLSPLLWNNHSTHQGHSWYLSELPTWMTTEMAYAREIGVPLSYVFLEKVNITTITDEMIPFLFSFLC